jgi:chemotaxis protein MotA
MDKLSLFGLLVALTGILGGQMIEGGSVAVLMQLAAFLIVFGGTIGAVMLQHPMKVFMTGLKMAGWVFVTPQLDTQKLAYQITAWGSVARKDGILALEAQLKNIDDPFVYKGLQMLVDGNSAEKIREVMDVDLQTYETLRWQAARVWESAAGYAPTIGILGGQMIEGGSVAVLMQMAAFLIVFGGTMGAVMLQHPSKVFMTGLKMAGWVFVTPEIDTQKLAYQITAWGSVARKDGILALEAQLKNIDDPFVHKGLQMLVDGNSAEKIREVMDVDLQTYETLRWQAARVWESAAGYAPTIGILGAVLGLVHVMQSLAEPAKLGAGIAVAFIATIYGVGSANLLFLPIAGKLKIIIGEQVNMREMLIDGLCMVANAENPRFIETKLKGYVEEAG